MQQLPIPPFFDPNTIGQVWRVPYHERANQAENWAKQHNIPPASQDQTRICLLAIDIQNTFCLPDFELYVAGQSGTGAIDDNRRLCEFIYHYLPYITTIIPTLDTHTAMQIFHPFFWVNEAGEHPTPATTLIMPEDVEQGVWKVNPAVADSIANGDYTGLQKYAFHYVKRLTEDGKYPLNIWPYHAMLGGISHALVAAVEEACFFHNITRHSQTQLELKGNNPLTENYSVLRPEVLEDSQGKAIAQKNTALLEQLLAFDAILIAGQAKSHCVAWTIEDLLDEIKAKDPSLAQKVYLLEDCTSPVVVPNLVDFTEKADQAFQRFSEAGMHLVKSTDPMESWPGFPDQ
ncbi:isochorismatase [Spirulina sp. CS-785/01]|uniref:isochorismatase n=1 Tax=Spirulina sp. CS-785/01 TaxID=3021716 RepID=UPI00232C5B51|nr:isochorismatase [Spirulina sp. CS-785/01]MDB9314029.1 isochorismatase [Spirulina sp. CS-785/01]